MKKLLLFTFVFFGFVSKTFSENNYYNYNDQPISFTENNVSFAVYKNGVFDFYIDRVAGFNLQFNTPHVSLSFNSGYNYNPYIQYDRYGAVIQVENIPIYYDYYGRVSQIGSVRINYHNGWISRVGGLHIYYNNYGSYAHYSGYINRYNRHHVHVHHHHYFHYPRYDYVVVSHKPYRRHYHPKRYAYHKNHKKNHYYNKRDYRYYTQNSRSDSKSKYTRRATKDIPKRKSDYDRVARRSEFKKDLYRGTPIDDDNRYKRAVSERTTRNSSQRSSGTSTRSTRQKPIERNATELFAKDKPERRSIATSTRNARTTSKTQKSPERRDAKDLFKDNRTQRASTAKKRSSVQSRELSKVNSNEKKSKKNATNKNPRHLSRNKTNLN